MTRREMLKERYEEALFALLLDEVAEAEGRKIMEEQAQLQPMISPEARERCRKVIAHQTRQQETKRVTMRAGRIVAKVAVIALVAVLLLTTAFATIPAIREKVYETAVAVLSDRTQISISASEEGASGPPKLKTDWIPEGFTLQSEGQEEMSVWRQYENENGDMISVYALDMQGGSMSYDTETAPMKDIQLNGHDAYLIDDGEVIQFIWQWTEDPAWLVTVTTDGLTIGPVLRVAENVKMSKVTKAPSTSDDSLTNWVPMGFSLVDKGNDTVGRWERYENGKGALLEANIYASDRDGFEFEPDTEGAKGEDVTLAGYPATLLTRGDEIQVVCRMEEHGFVLHICAENVREAAVLRVAENLKLMQMDWSSQSEVIIDLNVGERIAKWLPEGFVFAGGSESDRIVQELYVNEDAYADVCVFYGSTSMEIDTEGAVIEEIELNGHSAILATTGKKIQVLCVMAEDEKVLHILSERVSREDVLRVAESVDVF